MGAEGHLTDGNQHDNDAHHSDNPEHYRRVKIPVVMSAVTLAAMEPRLILAPQTNL